MSQVKRRLSFNKTLYVCKMIDILGNIGSENLVAILKRQVIILVLVKTHMRVLHDCIHACDICRSNGLIWSHLHMWPHVHMSWIRQLRRSAGSSTRSYWDSCLARWGFRRRL